VYASINGGATWTNVSGTLPNLPINCVVHQNGATNGKLYVATDVGVYYRPLDSVFTDFGGYGQGLPNVMVHELEINYANNMLFAATYGRGIWQIKLSQPTPIATSVKAQLKANVYPVPTTGMINVEIENAVRDIQVDVYKLSGEKVKTYRYQASEAAAIRFDISDLPLDNTLFAYKVATRLLQSRCF
jgi:hypothetical protein